MSSLFDREGNNLPVLEWIAYMHSRQNRIALTRVRGSAIETSFVGIDRGARHQNGNYDSGYRAPETFETRISHGHRNVSGASRLYSTHEDAVAGHAEMVQWVLDGGQPRKTVSAAAR